MNTTVMLNIDSLKHLKSNMKLCKIKHLVEKAFAFILAAPAIDCGTTAFDEGTLPGRPSDIFLRCVSGADSPFNQLAGGSFKLVFTCNKVIYTKENVKT